MEEQKEENKSKEKKKYKKTVAIAVLVTLLVLSLGYILGSIWLEDHDVKVIKRTEGIIYNQFYITAARCQQIPLIAGDQTINLIAIECLQ